MANRASNRPEPKSDSLLDSPQCRWLSIRLESGSQSEPTSQLVLMNSNPSTDRQPILKRTDWSLVVRPERLRCYPGRQKKSYPECWRIDRPAISC